MPSKGSKSSPKLVIYTHDQCRYCDQLKQFLQKHKLRYREQNIARSRMAEREYAALGFRSVPALVYGKTQMTGFDPKRLTKLFKL